MCTLTITQVFGIGPDLSGIRVSGKVTDCAPDPNDVQVVVGISCESENGPFLELPAQVASNGNWQVLFGETPGCICAGRVFVRAQCVTDPNCSTGTIASAIRCFECPRAGLDIPSDDVGPGPVEVTCNPDGTASVQMAIEVFNPTPSIVLFHFNCGPGGTHEAGPEVAGIPPGDPPHTFTVTCRYNTPGEAAPFVEFLDVNFEPFGCPPVPIAVGPLPECPPSNCPQILDVMVQILGCEPDPEDGNQLKRLVRFTPVVTLSDQILNHTWIFGDSVTDSSGGAPIQIDHPYGEAPSNQPSLIIFVEDCDSDPFGIPPEAFDDFELCECPRILNISVNKEGCQPDPADENILRQKVTFTPTFAGPPPTDSVWTFGDGVSELGELTVSHWYAQAPTEPPKLCIGAGAPCADDCREVPLSELLPLGSCDGTDPSDDDTSPSWCGAFTYAIAAVLALATAATILLIALNCLSVPVPGWLGWVIVGLFVAAALLIAVAYVLCGLGICPCLTRCDWLFIAWVPLLAGAIIAASLWNCCPEMKWVALGMFAAAIAAFVAWIKNCNPTRCEVFDAIVLILVSGVAPVLGYLQLIPPLKACSNSTVNAVVLTLGAIAAAAAIACHATATLARRVSRAKDTSAVAERSGLDGRGGTPRHRVRLPQSVVAEPVGLGQVVKRVTAAAKLNPCGPCNQRAVRLDRWLRIEPRK